MIHLVPLFLVICFCVYTKPWRLGRRATTLPPGPHTTPILGNATEFPRSFPFLKFTQWAEEYGDILSLKILDRTIIVLSSPTAVKDVLDKQSAATGDRPRIHILLEADGHTILNQNTNTNLWRTARKAIRGFLTRTDDELTRRAEYAQLLNDILDSPENVHTHLKRASVSIISTLVYGKRLPKYQGTEAERFFEGVQLLNGILDPSAHPPVDIIPILKYFPSFLAPWKNLCRRTREHRERLYNGLFDETTANIADGLRTKSYLAKILHAVEQQEIDMDVNELKALVKVLMDAGAESSTLYMSSFVLALINYPECQVKAQQELERVIGPHRFPTMDDFPKLTYLNSLIKEVHRFRTVAPIGFVHVASRDIQYKGYTIPAGSMIMPNLWGIYHNPTLFEDPDSFRPGRYMTSEFGTRADVDTYGFRESLPFGAGRRICPGLDMANETIAMISMNLLWAFKFSKDESGTGGIGLEAYHKPGILLSPRPFTCKATAQDAERARRIREAYARARDQHTVTQ